MSAHQYGLYYSKLRQALLYSVEEVARKSGVPIQTIMHVEDPFHRMQITPALRRSLGAAIGLDKSDHRKHAQALDQIFRCWRTIPKAFLDPNVVDKAELRDWSSAIAFVWDDWCPNNYEEVMNAIRKFSELRASLFTKHNQ